MTFIGNQMVYESGLPRFLQAGEFICIRGVMSPSKPFSPPFLPAPSLGVYFLSYLPRPRPASHCLMPPDDSLLPPNVGLMQRMFRTAKYPDSHHGNGVLGKIDGAGEEEVRGGKRGFCALAHLGRRGLRMEKYGDLFLLLEGYNSPGYAMSEIAGGYFLASWDVF